MRRRGRKKVDAVVYLYFAVNRVQRYYSFGAEVTKTGELDETDHMSIFGTLRNVWDKPFDVCELVLLPMRWPRDRMDKNATGIGSIIKVGPRTLYALVKLPDDSFYSLCGAAGRGEFKEFLLSVRDFKHGRGVVMKVYLSELTPSEDIDLRVPDREVL